MNIKQIQYFISVAEHLNFTKAAKENYLSQTAISQQIKNLEDNLGFKLFIRNKHSVKLTPSGDVFFIESKSLIETLNNAVNKASLASFGYIGTITIGFLEGYENILLPKLISNFKDKYPKISLNIIRGNIDELYKKLQNNLIDFVFGYDFAIDSYPLIKSKVVSSCPLCVVVYAGHKFSYKNSINRNELSNEDFIFIDRTISPFAFDSIISAFVSFGFSPNIKHTVDSIETSLLMVKSKLGITILPKFQDNYRSNDLVFIPLENEYVNSTISWNKNNTDSKIKIFLDFIDNE
ncbi:LysR family transcriptional regulator [Clostridium celatum]|uniref:LysR family transcriptional regulator n=1 Tax=Clostridium celatum TaxID=36834 RepID=UPI001898EB98|nr:LysR family transcriptional regulator [Clostridium celatum]